MITSKNKFAKVKNLWLKNNRLFTDLLFLNENY